MTEKINPELGLKRFLYLSSEEASFISGNPEFHKNYTSEKLTFAKNVAVVEDLVSRIAVMIDAISKEPTLPRKESLFVVLIALIRAENMTKFEVKHDLYTCALNLFENNADMFKFVQFYTQNGKHFPSGLIKIVSKYYFRQEPLELAKCVTESSSYHGWSHKDLFKLIHQKTDDKLVEVIVQFVLYGLDKAIATANDSDEDKEILELLKNVKAFRSTTDEKTAAELAETLKISSSAGIPPQFRKSQLVWEAVIGRMSLLDLLSALPKLYRFGHLKSGTLHDKVIEIFSNKEQIVESKIQPAELFIGLKTLEKGGRPRDPKFIKYLEAKEDVASKLKADPEYKKPDFAHQEPAKCSKILDCLRKALNISYDNLRPIGKNVMVTIDVSEQMNEPCLTSKTVTRLEAAALIAACMLRMNKSCAVAAFNGTTVLPLQVDKSSPTGQIIKKLKEAEHGAMDWTVPMSWAQKNKKQIDVFINVSATAPRSKLSLDMPGKDEEKFQSYCKKINLENSKLIVNTLGQHNLAYAVQLPDNQQTFLDVRGFDKNTINVMEGFSKNLF